MWDSQFETVVRLGNRIIARLLLPVALAFASVWLLLAVCALQAEAAHPAAPSVTSPVMLTRQVERNPAAAPQQSGIQYGSFTADWEAVDTEARAVAWGDFDNDGDLDLIAGSRNAPLRLYLNTNGRLSTTAVWTSSVAIQVVHSQSIAWGDYDNDGRLDLAIAEYSLNGAANNRVFRNTTTGLTPTFNVSAWTSPITDDISTAVAWGDYNRDGWLDLAIGNLNQPNRIYQNISGALAITPSWTASAAFSTTSLAWGDYNLDGYLDLMVGNDGGAGLAQPNQLYRNLNGVLGSSPIFTTTEREQTSDLDWGDFNNDQYPELAVANLDGPTRLYRVISATNQLALITNVGVPDTLAAGAANVAWGDYDNDGRLDLQVSRNGGVLGIYRNLGGALAGEPKWAINDPNANNFLDVEFGDMDGDGDLDLAVANSNNPTRVLGNITGIALPHDTTFASNTLAWGAPISPTEKSVIWGDYDNDDDLDLLVGVSTTSPSTNTAPSVLFENTQGILSRTPSPSFGQTIPNGLQAAAWGDYDSDGDLDLAIGNTLRSAEVFRNDGGSLSLAWAAQVTETVTSVAWADIDNDGNLDLALGSESSTVALRVLRSTGAPAFQFTEAFSAASTSNHTLVGTPVVWGDIDNDGDPDVLVGEHGNPGSIRLYSNRRGQFDSAPTWVLGVPQGIYSLALGDYNGDGLLDLATGGESQRLAIYRNIGGSFESLPSWRSADAQRSRLVSWIDIENDGDLDLFSTTFGVQRLKLYLNDGSGLSSLPDWTSPDNGWPGDSAWGDFDRDGDWDLAVAAVITSPGVPSAVIFPNRLDHGTHPGAIPIVSLAHPAPDVAFLGVGQIWEEPVLPITFTLRHPLDLPVRAIRASYSLNGGGQWLPAVPYTGTQTTNFTTPGTYVFNWDVYASGFYGQSDNVVFRIQAIPAISNTVGGTPGPYLYGSYAAHTFPFRIRGIQVRVISGTMGVQNALVYRLPSGQTLGGQLLADAAGIPFRTDGQGYLQGRAQLASGDQLFALLPTGSLSTTIPHTMYATSAAPTAAGLGLAEVNLAGGVQTLTVAAANPLALFDIDVSIEWDARADTDFQAQLRRDLESASAVLYDATEGQVALGRIRVFTNQENWNTAHMRVYSDNRLRPHAAIGGVITETVTDTVPYLVTSNFPNVYAPGQVHMPRVWNRFGDPRQEVDGDWALTLAHELAHYLLFQDDNYLGFDPANRLISVDSCRRSLMADPFDGEDTEFRPAAGWEPECVNTLSNRITGRSDWETIQAFFPQLNAPATLSDTLPGPANPPLAFTQVAFVISGTSPALADATQYLRFDDRPYFETSRARAFLFHEGQLVDLGGPVFEAVPIRGAREGDQVCVFDTRTARQGCKTLTAAGNSELSLEALPDWQPDLRIIPITTQAVQVQVSNLPAGLALYTQLFSDIGLTSTLTALSLDNGVYSATLTFTEPVLGGYVRVVSGTLGNTSPAVIAEFTVGGNPVGRVDKRSGGVDKRSGGTPVLSADGQVLLYTANINFPEGSFYVFQEATRLPDVPDWATVVGRGYHLLRSQNAPSLAGASLQFGYAERDVPADGELTLRVFYCQESAGGCTWQAIEDSRVDVEGNSVIATVQAAGLYTLMTSVELQLYPGLRPYTFPLAVSRTVTDGLASLGERVTLAYHAVPTATTPTWLVYVPGLSPTLAYVNDLLWLAPGNTYWLHLTQTATWRLNGSPPALDLAPAAAGAYPPAVIYGDLGPVLGVSPTLTSTLTARINGVDCGQGVIAPQAAGLVYVLKVLSAVDRAGCGLPGQTLVVGLDAAPEVAYLTWDNTRVQYVPLQNQVRLLLPLIVR